jgi:hypothetical protein
MHAEGMRSPERHAEEMSSPERHAKEMHPPDMHLVEIHRSSHSETILRGHPLMLKPHDLRSEPRRGGSLARWRELVLLQPRQVSVSLHFVTSGLHCVMYR